MGTPSRRILTITAVLGLFALPAVVSILGGQLAEHRATALVGGPVPMLEATTLSGARFSLAGSHGQIVVLNFWATWCIPCRAEMPLLQAAHAPANGVTVVGVNNREPAAVVRAFAAELGLGFPLVLDPAGDWQRAFGVVGYPTTVFINPAGEIYAVHPGVLTAGQLAQRLADGQP